MSHASSASWNSDNIAKFFLNNYTFHFLIFIYIFCSCWVGIALRHILPVFLHKTCRNWRLIKISIDEKKKENSSMDYVKCIFNNKSIYSTNFTIFFFINAKVGCDWCTIKIISKWKWCSTNHNLLHQMLWTTLWNLLGL